MPSTSSSGWSVFCSDLVWRQGWSVPRSRFYLSDNAFRPFPISCVIQILQLASLREPLCANGRHSEQAPFALPKSHKSARACKRANTRLAFQRPEGKWASTYSNFPIEYHWKIGIFKTLIHRLVWACPEICYICKTKQRLPLQKTSNCLHFWLIDKSCHRLVVSLWDCRQGEIIWETRFSMLHWQSHSYSRATSDNSML